MTNFKLPNKKQVYKQFLNSQLVGKTVDLFFAEYGREGSSCKYMVEQSLERLSIHSYWQPTNVQCFSVVIKDCEKCSIGSWFQIFFDPIEYVGLTINSAIITGGNLQIK